MQTIQEELRQAEGGSASVQQQAPIAPCPRCGMAVSIGQRFCHVCGRRLTGGAPMPPSAAPRQRRQGQPSTPLIFGLIALAALALGFAAREAIWGDGQESAPVASTNTGQEPTAAPPATVRTEPEVVLEGPLAGGRKRSTTRSGTSGTKREQTNGKSTSGNGSSGSSSIQDWPKGRSAFAVFLASADSRASAEARVLRARRADISPGILRSNDHPGLRPGYWVVFAGPFKSRQEAAARATRYARAGFPGYVRFVED